MTEHDLGAAGTRRLGAADATWRDGAFVDELPPLGDGLIAPMGGIWTNVVDLARWVAWLDDAYPRARRADDGPLVARVAP